MFGVLYIEMNYLGLLKSDTLNSLFYFVKMITITKLNL